MEETSTLLKRAKEKYADGQLESALSDLDKAIEIQPNCHEALRLRGGLSFRVRNYSQAISDFYLLTNTFPDSLYCSHGLYHSYLCMERVPDALAEASRFFEQPRSKEQLLDETFCDYKKAYLEMAELYTVSPNDCLKWLHVE